MAVGEHADEKVSFISFHLVNLEIAHRKEQITTWIIFGFTFDYEYWRHLTTGLWGQTCGCQSTRSLVSWTTKLRFIV